MKRIIRNALLLAFILTAWSCLPISADTLRTVNSSYESAADRTVDGVEFIYITTNPEKKIIHADPAGGVSVLVTSNAASPELLTDGTTVYYFETTDNRSVTLCKLNLNSGSVQRLLTFYTDHGSISDLIFVNGVLYFIEDAPEGTFASISLSRLSHTRIADGLTSLSLHRKYILATDGTGEGHSVLSVYNTGNGKFVRTAVANPIRWYARLKYVYAASLISGVPGSGRPYAVRVVRYNLANGKTTGLLSLKKVKGIKKLNHKRIVYLNAKGKAVTKNY